MRSDCVGESVAAASRGSRLPFGLMNEERQEAFVSGWSLGFVWDLGFGFWIFPGTGIFSVPPHPASSL